MDTPREWKPGYKTSECWLTVVILAISAVLTIGAVFYCKTRSSEIISGIVSIAAIAKAHAYSMARTELKKLWIQYFGQGQPIQPPHVPTPPAPPTIIIPPPVPIAIPTPITTEPELVTITTKTSRGVTITTMKVRSQ